MNAPTQIKQDPIKTLGAMLYSQQKQIQLALPRNGLTVDRFTRIALTELRKNPQLQQADPISFLAAVIQSAQLGLELGSGLGHGYLAPFRNKGRLEVQFIPGYRGFIDLALRSGKVAGIWAYPVYERDEFDCSLGSKPFIHHKFPRNGDRGEIELVYACGEIKGGITQFHVMSIEEINKVKDKATANKSHSPWFTDFIEMARKTPVRRLFKYLPASPEMARLSEIEDANENDLSLDIADFETGEPITLEPPVTVPSTDEVETHKRLEALAAVWSEVIEAGGEPDKLVRMAEADIVKAPKAKQEQTILFLRDWLKSKGQKPNV